MGSLVSICFMLGGVYGFIPLFKQQMNMARFQKGLH